MTPTCYHKGEHIVLQGAQETRLFLIDRGQVEVHEEKEGDTRPQPAAPTLVLKENQFFGELSFILGEPCDQSVWCKEDTDLWALSRDVFFSRVEEMKDGQLIRELLDKRRRQYRISTLVKGHQLKPQNLKPTSFFKSWNEKQLQVRFGVGRDGQWAGQGRAGQGWGGLGWAGRGRAGEAKQGQAGAGRGGQGWAGVGIHTACRCQR